MSSMETIQEDFSQGHIKLYHAGNSDVSDASHQSYQVEGFPGTRQSSINTEPMTLDDEELGKAKDEAEHILETVGPEEAANVFTKDLKHEAPITEEAMAEKLTSYSGKNLLTRNGQSIPDEEVAKQVGDHFDEILQKATEVVEANEKLSQASKPSPGSEEKQPAGE